MGQCGFHCWEQHILVKETVNFKNEEGKKKKKKTCWDSNRQRQYFISWFWEMEWNM